jgi:hypothetical protein
VQVKGGTRMGQNSSKASVTMDGTVEKIIQSPHPSIRDKAQIAIEGADELYREVRIENSLINEIGEEVALKEGATVEVVVNAEPEATTAKP